MQRELAVGRIYKHYSGEYYVVKGTELDLVIYENMKTGVELKMPIMEFLETKVPEDVDSLQEFQFERADIIHKLNKPRLELAVLKNYGYCPCAVKKNEDTLCMCKEFRERMSDGPCHCGLYTKCWLGDQM